MICLYYIHDPMCSWCYAFTQSWANLQKILPGDIQVINVVGGLAPDSNEPMPLNTQKMVQQAWQTIEKPCEMFDLIGIFGHEIPRIVQLIWHAVRFLPPKNSG